MENPAKHIGLILVVIMAFLCATVLAVTRSVTARANQNEWLYSKHATAVSCNKNLQGDAGSSGDKNNGGGCAHQLGASSLLAISAEKRNKIHSC